MFQLPRRLLLSIWKVRVVLNQNMTCLEEIDASSLRHLKEFIREVWDFLALSPRSYLITSFKCQWITICLYYCFLCFQIERELHLIIWRRLLLTAGHNLLLEPVLQMIITILQFSTNKDLYRKLGSPRVERLLLNQILFLEFRIDLVNRNHLR